MVTADQWMYIGICIFFLILILCTLKVEVLSTVVVTKKGDVGFKDKKFHIYVSLETKPWLRSKKTKSFLINVSAQRYLQTKEGSRIKYKYRFNYITGAFKQGDLID